MSPFIMGAIAALPAWVIVVCRYFHLRSGLDIRERRSYTKKAGLFCTATYALSATLCGFKGALALPAIGELLVIVPAAALLFKSFDRDS